MPIPLVPDGPSWRFDTAAGKEEILNRRIGQNELNTIQVCLAYVDAQRDYFARIPTATDCCSMRSGSPAVRQSATASTGRRTRGSRRARSACSSSGRGARGTQRPANPVAYCGYYYRILTAQGPDAPGGAYDYLAHGKMFGGFALVAYPAQYGVSGVMTLIVNQDGVVYQKDLGPKTAASPGR